MNSKIEARIEAVKLALNVEGVTSENIIDVSEKIADFIIGSADLADIYDSNAYMKEMLSKIMPSPEAEKIRMENDKAFAEMIAKLKKKSDDSSDPETAEKARTAEQSSR